MKRLNHWVIFMLIAALPAAALDWNQADPAAQWRRSLFADPSAPSAILARPPSGGGVAGQFGSYVLALHGLWPDKAGDTAHAYGYCGVDSAVRALDRASTWCRMPAPGLSDSVMSLLKPLMPGTASCLENHEWYKHGSCSGFTPDEYFSRASALVSYVAQTNFGRFLSEHAGQTVTSDAFLSAFESGFGAGSRNRVSLTCTKARGVDMLLEVRLRLTHPLRPATELGRMLLPADGVGNCPASFKLDEFTGF